MKSLALFLLCLAAPAAADVALADIFGELAVLQRGIKIPVWGTADPGEKVTVSFEGQTASAVADESGAWRVALGPFEAVAARPMTVSGKNRIVLQRLFVGEVWVCSGQSNMAFPTSRSEGATAALDEAEDPRLFLYTVRHHVAAEPVRTAGGSWVRASRASVAPFSAVAYYFGRRIREKLGVPVGLIHASWGGTPAEAWTRPAALQADEVTAPIVTRWDAMLEAYPRNLENWKAAVEKWKADGSKGRQPRQPPGPGHPHRASGLFNGMIAPLLPYAIRGAIWYQGESNAGRAEQYRTLFPLMIRDWRDAWGQGDFPFYFVQLANFRAVRAEPGESEWAELREAQALALALPHTAMAVTIDIGAANDIHPRNKTDVGERLARPALANLYRESVVPSGPLYESHEIRGGRVTIRFRHADGLRARGSEPLEGFTIAGKDRKFLPADARVEKGAVVVSHPRIEHPASVRYAWADNPVCNLVNGAGLPASPFRTDDWPGVTAGRR